MGREGDAVDRGGVDFSNGWNFAVEMCPTIGIFRTPGGRQVDKTAGTVPEAHVHVRRATHPETEQAVGRKIRTGRPRRQGHLRLVAAREMVRLARVLPRTVALRMALMGKHERMSAERAYELGMVTEVVEHDRLLERAHEIADIVNSNAPLAVRGTRLAIHKTLDLPLLEGEILAETFRERVVRTEDAAEGPLAFVEKRVPNWKCR